MVLIFVMSSSPNPPRPPGGLPDVVVHALVYAALGAFVLRGLARAKMTNVTFGLAAVAVGIATLYGLSDELHQSFVPGRVSDVRDLVADGVGAIVGVTLVGAWSIVLSFRQPR
jgi:VanZ family protein